MQDETEIVEPQLELVLKLAQARDCLERAADAIEAGRLPASMVPYFKRQLNNASRLLSDVERIATVLDRRQPK